MDIFHVEEEVVFMRYMIKKTLFIMIVCMFLIDDYAFTGVYAEEASATESNQEAGLEFYFDIAGSLDIEHYGGAYFDDNGNLIMLYTNYDTTHKNESDCVIQEASQREYVDIKQVSFSYQNLKNYLNILIEQVGLEELGIIALDIDIINNKVQVFIDKLDDGKVATVSSLIPIEAVDFIEGQVINMLDIEAEGNKYQNNSFTNMLNSAITLTPGQKICYGSGMAASMCLPGFGWINSANNSYEYGFLTAGHISASVGDFIYDADNKLIGTVARKSQTSSVDVAFVKYNSAYDYDCAFLDGDSAYHMYSFEEDYGIPVNTKITVYSHLGNATGLLISNNYTYVNGNTVWSNMIRTTAHTANGFSGAPVAINDSSYAEHKVVLGYHIGRAIVNGEAYAFHGNFYYVKIENPDWVVSNQ